MTSEKKEKDGPRETRRDRQKRETREVIQRAAESLFGSFGFEATTIRAIASEAGVGVGTVHLHFQDKESLLLECLIDGIAENDRRSWESMPRTEPLKVQLLHLAREGYLGWTRQPSLSRAVLRQTLFSRRPEMDRLRALDAKVIRRVTSLLTDAQERGEIRADADPALATKAIFSFYLTSSLNWLGGMDEMDLGSEPGSYPIPEAGTDPALTEETLGHMLDETRRFLDQIFRGIGSEEGGEE